MTDLNESDDETTEEELEDVTAALEATGYVEDEGDEDADSDGDSRIPDLPGPLRMLEELHGTGKPLESYEGSPIAEAVGPEGSKGALHIARGVDGLSPLGAMNPLMDIGIGFVLLQLEKADDGDDGPDFGDDGGDEEPTNFGDTT